MVSNCGFDDSGENAGKQNHLQSVPASDDIPSLNRSSDLSVDYQIEKAISKSKSFKLALYLNF